VGVDIYSQDDLAFLVDSLDELALLADTAGLDVVGQVTQKLTIQTQRRLSAGQGRGGSSAGRGAAS